MAGLRLAHDHEKVIGHRPPEVLGLPGQQRRRRMKITVTVELDQEAYDKAYGPGSEFWEKYHKDDAPETYAPSKPKWLEEGITEVLEEGFWDWTSKGWLKLTFS